VLDLSTNVLHSAVPSVICVLPALRQLLLSEDLLFGKIPAAISDLAALKQQRLRVIHAGLNDLSTGDSCAYHCASETMATELEATTSAPSTASRIARDFVSHRCRRPSRPTVRCGHRGARTMSPPPSAPVRRGCQAGHGSCPPSLTRRSSATTQTPSSQSWSRRSCHRYCSETLVLGAEEDGGLRVVEEASRRRRVGEGNRRGGELESRIHGRRLDEPMANPWAVGWIYIH
jgi:hypothetical protein